MYTLEGGEDESITLRPEGTAPVCRAYLEHGMHKLPQPVKLWYLSSFFRRERPQKGRFRQFWQIGIEAIGSDDPAVDAESILLLAELLEALGCRGIRLRIGSLGTPDTRLAYREPSCRSTCARTRASCPPRSSRGSTSTRCARSTPTTAGTRRVMAGAPRLLDRLNDADREHFEAVKRDARRRRPGLRGRRHARARARLLHAHGVRVHAPMRSARSRASAAAGATTG